MSACAPHCNTLSLAFAIHGLDPSMLPANKLGSAVFRAVYERRSPRLPASFNEAIEQVSIIPFPRRDFTRFNSMICFLLSRTDQFDYAYGC